MATIIDALVVTLGLDATTFTSGARETSSSFKKVSDDASARAKEIEAAGKRAAEFFSTLRNQVLGLFAAFTAGKGLKEFVGDITSMDAPVSRMARNLGISTETLSTWGKAAQLAGGSVDSAANSFQGFSSELQTWRSTGESGIIQWLRALQAEGGHAIDINKPLADSFLDIAANLKVVGDHSGLARANFIGKQLGLDPGFVLLLVQGTAATKALLAEATKLGAVTKEEGEAAEKRRAAWIAVGAVFEKVGRIVLTVLTPALLAAEKVLEKFGEWAQQHPRLLTAAFLTIAAAAAALSVAMIAGLSVGALGVVIQGITAVAGAFGVLSAAILGTPAGWIIAALAAIGVAGYALYANWDNLFGASGATPKGGSRPTRGDRNNNPGNIEYGRFAVAHGATGSDGRFAVFPTRTAGQKAMASLLHDKYSGLTLAEIQKRWVGNSDPNYLRSMASATGLKANDVPNLEDNAVVANLMLGMMRGEGTAPAWWAGVPIERALAPRAAQNIPPSIISANNSRSRASTVTTHVGEVNVSVQNGDPDTIAAGIAGALRRNSLANQANYGTQ